MHQHRPGQHDARTLQRGRYRRADGDEAQALPRRRSKAQALEPRRPGPSAPAAPPLGPLCNRGNRTNKLGSAGATPDGRRDGWQTGKTRSRNSGRWVVVALSELAGTQRMRRSRSATRSGVSFSTTTSSIEIRGLAEAKLGRRRTSQLSAKAAPTPTRSRSGATAAEARARKLAISLSSAVNPSPIALPAAVGTSPPPFRCRSAVPMNASSRRMRWLTAL